MVNNNIVLIDTYQEYARYMPRLEAIVRTAESRIRPVLLTTITTIAGLTPMVLGLSLDFFGGGYAIDSPTALWWKQLATAVVFGLGVATFLTLLFTPSMLALRVWLSVGAYRTLSGLRALSMGAGSQEARDPRPRPRRAAPRPPRDHLGGRVRVRRAPAGADPARGRVAQGRAAGGRALGGGAPSGARRAADAAARA